MTNFENARTFLLKEGRVLEQRLFSTLFEGEPAAGVVDALRAYRNPDGGFGHGLEPDKRAPTSVPGDVDFAFQALIAAGADEPDLVGAACDFLDSVTDADGAVALASPAIEAFPRAEHWGDWTYAPGVFPTAGLVAGLYEMGIDHPWRARATAYCWKSIDAGLPDDAHAIAQILRFLEHVPERVRADAFERAVAEKLPKAQWFRADADDPNYGVTPLWIAPKPDSRWRTLFDDRVVQGHLDRLERDQQPDGGWPITWEPPSAAAVLEWRGIVTVQALQVLKANNRL